MVKRSLYKTPRAPARTKGVLHNQAPIACQDANGKEIAMALTALCLDAGVVVGRGGLYDALRDEYTVIGKSIETGKAQDFRVRGEAVAALIGFLRGLNNTKAFDSSAIVKKFEGQGAI
jgi:hypothetical protein